MPATFKHAGFAFTLDGGRVRGGPAEIRGMLQAALELEPLGTEWPDRDHRGAELLAETFGGEVLSQAEKSPLEPRAVY